ncbi:LysR family transcriptional regulator (plasmid) [Roseibium aggregatum]|uniref:LysR family transcriptional regulator n=1 Tax=Roseibium aggregatum TaxID=187304 RepID=UPI001E4A37C4|nr:LysR family transcriptional regulator [Roseibium aggregatum]UES60016.1 LysR family transcriptional regulator [Roseibium aggregatum]UES60140.1 LysR family transcriptional regulator [Roseibium aggregatum]
MRHGDLEAFLVVARTCNFRRAAKERGVTASALSQSVRSLEDEIGVRLLNRTTRSVSLTEAGELLVKRTAPAFEDIRTGYEEVRSLGRLPAGRLRINAPAPALDWLIVPHVTEFLEKYPDISLELVEDASNVDIVADRYDAGVRLGLEMANNMIAVPIGPAADYAVAASPSYLASHGEPGEPVMLNRHNCIRQRFPSGRIFPWRFARDGQELTVIPEGTLTVTNARHAVDAARRGLGIARVAAPYAQPYLKKGSLIRILTDWSPGLPAWHLYYPSRRQVPPTLRAFIDFFRGANS